MRGKLIVGFCLGFLFSAGTAARSPTAVCSYDLAVLPPERKIVTDEVTGATLTFLTTDPAKDTNLYFHDRSWLADESMILFYSDREDGGLMGYLTATGELVRFTTEKGSLGRATAMVGVPGLYAVRNRDVLELRVRIEFSPNPTDTPSRVHVTERHLCTLPESDHTTALNENCDGTTLSIGIGGGEVGTPPAILLIDVATGDLRELYRVPESIGYAAHVQWSHTDPSLLSFAGLKERLNVVDVRSGKRFAPYKAAENELVTHESWWVENRMLFCGGLHREPTEDSHVKVLDVATGTVRIIGAGAWWPTGTDEEIAKRNWWHASGSEDGRWVAADNWHGDIMLFEGKTTRPHLLTQGHRTYGSGEHPHVGWDRTGNEVVFTSHRLGNPDVCIAEIPETWLSKP